MMYLTNKIAKPAYPVTMIDRLRLYQQLDRWTDQRAIVIHAPTGYGKSSLVSRWIDLYGCAFCTAWLSLDEGDSDPRHFVQHLVAALDRIIPGVLPLAQPIIEDSDGNAERVLTRLFSTFWDETSPEALPGDQHTLLVLDDLHRTQSAQVDAVISTILEQGPPNLHLLLLARHRTTLPLARLYAHGDILALDADDLQFTVEEINEFLLQHGFSQPAEVEVMQLAERSEGWVAALQLAVLTLRGRGGVSDLLHVLHGESTWLAEYLIDEVLYQQTPELRRFLLQTSILDEFNAGLCAAVTGDDKANVRLNEIARADLFLIQLDEIANWFRYHHLFQELLQHRLKAQSAAEIVAGLHKRAASWLAAAGDTPSAVRHFLASGAENEAAMLVEEKLRATLVHDPYQASDLIALLPHDLLVQRPQLMLDRCRLAAFLDDKRLTDYAQEARQTLQAQPDSAPAAARHHAEWLVFQVGSDYMQRDLGSAAGHAEQIQIQVSHLDDLHVGMFHFLQMHLKSYEGKHAEGMQSAEVALAAFERADCAWGTVGLRRELAKWNMRRGNSGEATRRFQELFDHWSRDHLLTVRDMIFACFFAAENSYWQDHLDQAQVYQQAAMDLSIQLQDADLIQVSRCLGQVLGGNVRGFDAEVQDLSEYLKQISALSVADLLLDYETRFLIASGRADLAWRILQESGNKLQNIPADHVHRKLITYLRVRIALGVDLEAITPTLVDALALATENEDRFSQLQLLALTAWLKLRLEGAPAAAETLLEAANLTQETGYVRVLLDIPQLASLLQEMGVSLITPTMPSQIAASATLEPIALTDQEQRVLNLLAADYSYQQIADELVISINTVRTHVRHIYRKLNVRRRNKAVQRARLRGLLPESL